MRFRIATFFFILTFLAATSTPAQTAPAAAPAPDLSSPKAAILSLYAALKAGDIPLAKKCLTFTDAKQAETFELSVTPLWAPLKLMHAMEAKFGAAARQPFSSASLEKTVDKAVDDLNHADIKVDGDQAVIAEKKAAVDPGAETEITGITLKKIGGQWLVVAATFPDITAEIPPADVPLMRAMKNAVAEACQTTLARLAKGEFKSADEAYAAYQTQLQSAARAGAATAKAR